MNEMNKLIRSFQGSMQNAIMLDKMLLEEPMLKCINLMCSEVVQNGRRANGFAQSAPTFEVARKTFDEMEFNPPPKESRTKTKIMMMQLHVNKLSLFAFNVLFCLL